MPGEMTCLPTAKVAVEHRSDLLQRTWLEEILGDCGRDQKNSYGGIHLTSLQDSKRNLQALSGLLYSQ